MDLKLSLYVPSDRNPDRTQLRNWWSKAPNPFVAAVRRQSQRQENRSAPSRSGRRHSQNDVVTDSLELSRGAHARAYYDASVASGASLWGISTSIRRVVLVG